jgi:hypothetical protein
MDLSVKLVSWCGIVTVSVSRAEGRPNTRLRTRRGEQASRDWQESSSCSSPFHDFESETTLIAQIKHLLEAFQRSTCSFKCVYKMYHCCTNISSPNVYSLSFRVMCTTTFINPGPAPGNASRYHNARSTPTECFSHDPHLVLHGHLIEVIKQLLHRNRNALVVLIDLALRLHSIRLALLLLLLCLIKRHTLSQIHIFLDVL